MHKLEHNGCSCSCCGGEVAMAVHECGAVVEAARLESASFEVGGLDCADCAAKVEKAVRRLNGVAEARLNFAVAKLKVNYDSAVLSTEDILRVITGFGYSAALVTKVSENPGLRKTVFRLSGLDCADCAAKLEKRIAALAGVQAVTLNFGAGKMTVEHSIKDEDIIAAVEQAGYQAVTDSEAGKATLQAVVWWRKPRMLATIVSGLLVTLAMVLEWTGTGQLSVPCYVLAMLTGGYHVAKSGLYSLRSLTLDTNFLMVIAVIGAAAIGEWSEGATVVFLFSLGNALQAYTLDKTRTSIRALMELAPREALVRRNGEELRLPVEEIVVGDVILVKPGERIAMDGTVQSGSSTVNQAAITGESMPVEKQTGDLVYAGTVNEQGALTIVVTKLAADSTLAKIMHMVEEAQAEKAPLQQVVDVFAKYYTPAVILAAVGLTIIPPFFFQQPFELWFYRALVLLVISCPCALVISTPVSIVSAIGNASRRGVLIKGGAYLEQMGKIRAMAFDKTGTLTVGKPRVTEIIRWVDTMQDEDVLTMAAAVEKWSEHPLAEAVVAQAGDRKLPPVANFKALVGRGAQADLAGQTIYVGNVRLFEELGFALAARESHLSQLEQQGKTVMLVGSGQEIYGVIAVADTVRADSAAAVAALKATGIEQIVMLTGDNNRVAAAIAQKTGVDAFYAELLPADKVATLQQMIGQYGMVAMVGDGVNDAPALATASVGVAMGVAGSDTALETADIALMADDLGKLAYVMRLSRKTVAVIKQNITFSLLLKLLFVIGTFVGFVNLWLAVLADTGAALLVTLNGMRLVRELK
ncbi:putative cadmium-transporting ATPase [Sporomusa aerivorans]|uniref:heavy metal translocating P-type ATPase n=1 Tax=Sporomusa aerivorans TaxID=204936 RepID=UPI003A6BEF7B